MYGDSLLNTTFWTWLSLDQLFAGEQLQLLDKTPISCGTPGRRGAISESRLDQEAYSRATTKSSHQHRSDETEQYTPGIK